MQLGRQSGADIGSIIAPLTDGAQPHDELRVVITHDFMETYGGAERVTQEMAKAFPNAQVVAILGRPEVAERMGVADRFRSLLPPARALLKHYRPLAPAFPAIVRAARLPAADVLLSSSYAFAHRFRTSNRAPQVCYCHSPLRFAWSMTGAYREQHASSRLSAMAFNRLAAAMRRGDRAAAQRVTAFITQSPFTARQIESFYGREAAVVGAPVDCELFRPDGDGPDDYFLFCGRLIEPYKKVALVIEAFRRLGKKLVVAGDGPAYAELAASAPPNVEFAGHVADEELVPLMQRCRAAIFPSRDDFGLIPVEVMACGRPVLAYGEGGALYTVRPGVTGELFAEQTVEEVERVVSEFDAARYDTAAIRAHAERWDSARFRERIVAHVRGAAGHSDGAPSAALVA